MSSGQSLRNGSSVEPGLPNTFLMPNARSRSKVACLTVTVVLAGLAGLRDKAACSQSAVIARSQRVARNARPMTGSATKQSRVVCATLDCFASLAMTVSPRRRSLHGRLARGVCGPQFHAGGGVVGVDGELAAFEQRLHAAIAEFLRRLTVVQLGCEFDDQRRLQWAVEDQAGITLDPGDVVAVVMDTVAVEGQCRIAEQQHWIGDVGFPMSCNGR